MGSREEIETKREAVISERKSVEYERLKLESQGLGSSPGARALWTRQNELLHELGILDDLLDEIA